MTPKLERELAAGGGEDRAEAGSTGGRAGKLGAGKGWLGRVWWGAMGSQGSQGAGPSAGGARLNALDGLRGLAALAVSLFHLSILLSGTAAAVAGVLAFTPLVAAWRGTNAVILFFVLSGFVLGLPFSRGPVHPSAFLAKRVARIYPAYWAAMALTLGVVLVGVLKDVVGPQLTLKTGLNYVVLVGTLPAVKANPVVWSLVQEMRVSVAFPYLMLAVKRVKAGWLLAGTLPVAGAALWFLSADGLSAATGAGTVLYAWFFVLGAVLAKHKDSVVGWVRVWPGWVKAMAGTAALAAYGMPLLDDSMAWWANGLGLLAVGAGAAGLVVLALGWEGMGKVLAVRPVAFLGRVSYGYYLVHFPLMALVLWWWMHSLPGWALVGLTVGLSVVVAWGLNVWVERPGIALGRHLAGWLEERWEERGAPAGGVVVGGQAAG